MLIQWFANRFLEGPPKSVQDRLDASWTATTIDGPRGPVCVYSKRPSCPVTCTMVLVHGWTSGVVRSANRVQRIVERGVQVHLMEVRGHGGTPHEGPWTAGAVVDDLVAALQSMVIEGPLVLYGHSLGAFVALRMFHPSILHCPVDALILESPMSMYGPVFDEGWSTLGWVGKVPGLRKAVLRSLVTSWQRQHPRAGIASLDDVGVPAWGMPTCPTLVVQAEPDRRLGPLHLEALLKAWPSQVPIEVVRDQTLRHSGTSVHPGRDEVLVRWLESQGLILRR